MKVLIERYLYSVIHVIHMEKETLVVRKVNKIVYKRFKQRAVEDDENIGEALTEAMEYWLVTKHKKTKPDIRNLLKANGFIKTGKKVKWSEEIDKALYGGNL